MLSRPECVKHGSDLVQLWVHESRRVYSDRIADSADLQLFHRLQTEVVQQVFEVSKINIFSTYTKSYRIYTYKSRIFYKSAHTTMSVFDHFLNLLLEAACAARTTDLPTQQQREPGALLWSCRRMGTVEEHPDSCTGHLQPASFHHGSSVVPGSNATCVSVLAAKLSSIYCSEYC